MNARPSLRGTLTTAVVALGVVAVVVAAALVVATTKLRTAAEQLGAAVESVRLAEEAEIGLLLHDRAQSAVGRARLESDVRSGLRRAGEFVGSASEQELLDRAAAAAEAYFAATPATQAALLADAVGAAEAVVEENVAQAAAARSFAATWDVAANFVGIGAGAALVIAVAWFVWWLRRVAFGPISDLADDMKRFTRGERDVRAAPRGPAELALVAERFNELADAVARRHEDQLAFVAAVAHDLKGPMTALSLSTAPIRAERPLPDEATIRRVVDLVRRQATRLARMTDDLLDTTAIEAGRLDLRTDDVDLRDVVADVADLYRASSPIHELVVRVPDHAVTAHADAARLQQVLGNLVHNAVKYSPGGGVVDVALEERGREAVLRVRDQGIGIAADDLARVFEPFRRTKATRGTFAGMGLGLSVARRIVEAHGGRIDVESRAGHGATFCVVLPRPDAQASAPRATASA